MEFLPLENRKYELRGEWRPDIEYSLEVDSAAFEVDIAAIGDGVAHGRAIGELGAALPVVSGSIFHIGGDPVEGGNLIDGDIPREVSLLLVRQRSAEV